MSRQRSNQYQGVSWIGNQWKMSLQELRYRVEYKADTEGNMTATQLSGLESKMEASIITQSRVSSKMPLSLEIMFSLIRVESRPEPAPDPSSSYRFIPTQRTGGRTGSGARLSFHHLPLKGSCSPLQEGAVRT